VFDGEMGIPKGWPQDEPVVKALLSHVKLSFDRQAPSWRISRLERLQKWKERS
jgi:hypothetical protein